MCEKKRGNASGNVQKERFVGTVNSTPQSLEFGTGEQTKPFT